MRYETQADLLRLLNVVGQHFAAASLSLRLNRSFDAVRILIMASLVTVSEAILRVKASDIPSQLSLHYAGKSEGPMHGKGFGVEMRVFAAESETFLLTDPALVFLRTQVLDYFHDQQGHVDDGALLFRWEQSMAVGDGEKEWLDRVSLDMGYPRGFAGEYLTGARGEVLRDFPELGFFRDIVFLLKTLMCPTNDALPEIKPWGPMDAELRWGFSRTEPKS